MSDWWVEVERLFTLQNSLNIIRAVLLLAVGLFVARLVAAAAVRLVQGRTDAGRTTLRRIVYYLVLVVFVVAALNQLGFNLGVLLGTAGVLTVAVGFAAQTSVSNIISGLFLIAERSFAVGDAIQVGSTLGEVLSIDLLSVKLRTLDNRLVRIPNESLIKSEVINLTRFPIRRLDLNVSVAYKEDLKRVREVLLGVAERLPYCLEEPAPQVVFQEFGASSLNLRVLVWVRREGFLEHRGLVQEEIKRAFDQAGIEIPFPHVSVYAGSVTEPLPVRLLSSDGAESRPGDADQRLE